MQYFRFMGIVPLGIGLTIMVALWSGSSPFAFAPLFFKVFATLVALPFVMMGVAALSGKLAPEHQIRAMLDGMNKLNRPDEGKPSNQSESRQGGYQCDGCGATLSDNADVSPHGDVKCAHCGRWFNIHKTVS